VSLNETTFECINVNYLQLALDVSVAESRASLYN